MQVALRVYLPAGNCMLSTPIINTCLMLWLLQVLLTLAYCHLVHTGKVEDGLRCIAALRQMDTSTGEGGGASAASAGATAAAAALAGHPSVSLLALKAYVALQDWDHAEAEVTGECRELLGALQLNEILRSAATCRFNVTEHLLTPCLGLPFTCSSGRCQKIVCGYLPCGLQAWRSMMRRIPPPAWQHCWSWSMPSCPWNA